MHPLALLLFMILLKVSQVQKLWLTLGIRGGVVVTIHLNLLNIFRIRAIQLT
jgi:hypothetical protein|tara:strand:+ start:433 stop:588 length:156 start_codon:yes stop_codon:yes gene_type:complete